MADFGIALAASKAGGTRMTETGMSLGTPTYMSPEQAMGERTLDARTDVYALGCVTYEMLVGDPPFLGSSAQAIVAKVLTEAPTPPSRQRDTIPEAVEDAVLTALAKLPADRFASAAEFAAALSGGGRATRRLSRAAVTARPAEPRSRRTLLYGALGLTTILALTASFTLWGRSRAGPSEAPTVVRFTLQPEPGSQIAFPVGGNIATHLALSTDGRQAVYAASHGGSGWTLDIRSFDQLHSRTLPGTEGASFPEFSPDGRWVAFGAADGSLKKIAVDGTALTTLCPLDAGGVVGLTWISDREIVFTRLNLAARGLWRVPSDGGQPIEFSQFNTASGERLQLWPRSGDQGRLVFYSSTRASNLDLTIGVVSTATGKTVLTGLRGARPLGLADGFLLYVRGDGALMASPFDTRSLRAGPPLQILDSIAVRAWVAPAALSASGSLLYQRGGLTSQLVSVDQRGVARVLLDSARVYAHPRLSPDGRRLAFEVQGGASSEIWVADLAAHTAERLTRGGIDDRPEGRQTAVGSSTARAARRRIHSGGSRPMAAGPPNWCISPLTLSGRACSLRRATPSCIGRTHRTATGISLYCRSPESGSRCRSWRAWTTTSTLVSHPTRGGWRTCRTSPAARRCTFARSQTRAAGSGYRPGVARSRSGRPTVGGSTTDRVPR